MTLGSDKRFRAGKAAIGLLLLILLGTAAGCGKHGKAAPTGGTDVPPSKMKLARNVNLARAEHRPLNTYVDTVGYVEAEGMTDIAAGVGGIVDGIFFREGQVVKKGQLLATLDQKRYQAAARLARANYKSAQVVLALAKDKLERNESTGGGGVSKEDLATSRLNVAKAEADLLSSQASQDLAERDLENSQIRAPYAGQINQRRVTVGSYVGVGPQDRNVIATMADLTRLRLVSYVPEKAVPIIQEMLKHRKAAWVEFELVPFPHKKFRGRIFYLSTTANPDTHMFEAKADVDAGSSDVVLKPGYTATIRLPLKENRHACVVPEVSVRASESGFIAFRPVQRVDRDGKPELDRDGNPVWVARRVADLRLGYRSPGWVEVTRGLRAGDWIIKKGAETLEDGTPINIPGEQLKELNADLVKPSKLRPVKLQARG